jgi:hypothetical protein
LLFYTQAKTGKTKTHLRRSDMPGMRPNKKELARMKVMQDIGLSPTAISHRLGKSHHTVIKYLNDLSLFDDPTLREMIETIRDKEISDLYLLGAKARARLHQILDEGNTKTIETVAVMDRSFQQRRLLEGRATEIVDPDALSAEIVELERQIAEYEAQKARTIDVTPHEEKIN